ncbi:hypothetical protein GALMADRAFT_1236714 [Galerina marginata CBS 339.88]|uniref:Uncharacterized protein n=1 Tax=Galerina marginata (strain CBS 339.88) TaxID=685588 RepID=A0A067T862_GALM3|nr:hypothetical protein GALMADRAFT_1236714 [Galerina marginata CBS 339.88]
MSRDLETRCGTLRNNEWIKNTASCYTAAQAMQWLACMNVDLGQNLATDLPGTSLETLSLLMKHHLLTFPFENTSMHYSPQHAMDITTEGLFQRLVVDRKGGSYCFGLNGLFLGMLRALGYRAFSGASRVNEGDPPGPPNHRPLLHQVIFVQPVVDSTQTYLVDVGFGAGGLARPIRLSNEAGNVIPGIGPREKHRLTRTAIPHSSVETSKDSGVLSEVRWNLEVLHEKNGVTDTTPWRMLYTFSEEEFYPKDFQCSSFFVSMMPDLQGLFWSNVICVKNFVLEDDHVVACGMSESITSREITYRMVMIGKEVKRSDDAGNTETIRSMNTELERIEALREIFGVNLHDDDALHITGRVAGFSYNHSTPAVSI